MVYNKLKISDSNVDSYIYINKTTTLCLSEDRDFNDEYESRTITLEELRQIITNTEEYELKKVNSIVKNLYEEISKKDSEICDKDNEIQKLKIVIKALQNLK